MNGFNLILSLPKGYLSFSIVLTGMHKGGKKSPLLEGCRFNKGLDMN